MKSFSHIHIRSKSVLTLIGAAYLIKLFGENIGLSSGTVVTTQSVDSKTKNNGHNGQSWT